MKAFQIFKRADDWIITNRCNKRKYKSKAKARKKLRLSRGTCKGVYKCKHCGFWHLTSRRLEENP